LLRDTARRRIATTRTEEFSMDLVTLSTQPSGSIPPASRIHSPALPPVPAERRRLSYMTGPDAVPPRRALSEREKQVLRLVCEGMSNAEIATRLGVSRDSIKTELKRIFQKISVRNRTQAAVMVTRQSMLAEQRL
jgi:DNA-binding NarL/FixJ family response regulator